MAAFWLVRPRLVAMSKWMHERRAREFHAGDNPHFCRCGCGTLAPLFCRGSSEARSEGAHSTKLGSRHSGCVCRGWRLQAALYQDRTWPEPGPAAHITDAIRSIPEGNPRTSETVH